MHCDTRWGHTPRQGTAARLRDLTFSARPISTAGVEGRVAAVLRVNLRAGTRPRSSAGTHGPAEVPGNAGGCHTGGGRRPLHLLRPSSLHLWRCAYPRNPPHTSPRHQDCTPGVPDHPTRTHDAAPPAELTRATCVDTPEHAPTPTPGGEERPLQVPTARARAPCTSDRGARLWSALERPARCLVARRASPHARALSARRAS